MTLIQESIQETLIFFKDVNDDFVGHGKGTRQHQAGKGSAQDRHHVATPNRFRVPHRPGKVGATHLLVEDGYTFSRKPGS
jgi:hypothetical protein